MKKYFQNYSERHKEIENLKFIKDMSMELGEMLLINLDLWYNGHARVD